MNRQMIRNENRLHPNPMFRVAAILDDVDDTRTALDALERNGIDVSTVDLLTGQEGARAPHRTSRTDGWRARLSRLFQRGVSEDDALDAHERAFDDGRNVIFVPARGNGESSQVVKILRAAGGRYILHFHPWNIALP